LGKLATSIGGDIEITESLGIDLRSYSGLCKRNPHFYHSRSESHKTAGRGAKSHSTLAGRGAKLTPGEESSPSFSFNSPACKCIA